MNQKRYYLWAMDRIKAPIFPLKNMIVIDEDKMFVRKISSCSLPKHIFCFDIYFRIRLPRSFNYHFFKLFNPFVHQFTVLFLCFNSFLVNSKYDIKQVPSNSKPLTPTPKHPDSGTSSYLQIESIASKFLFVFFGGNLIS